MVTIFQEQRIIVGKIDRWFICTRCSLGRLVVGRGQMPEFCFEFFDKFTQRSLGAITPQNGKITTQSSPLGS